MNVYKITCYVTAKNELEAWVRFEGGDTAGEEIEFIEKAEEEFEPE